MPPVIEIFSSDAGWSWRKVEDTSVVGESAPFSDRSAAFEDALVEREGEAIVLLRADGSVYGELYHAASSGGKPQHVDLLAATSRSSAVSVDG